MLSIFIQSLVILYGLNIQLALLFSVLHMLNTEKYITCVIRTYSYVHLSTKDRLIQIEVDGRNNNILLCLYLMTTCRQQKMAKFDLHFDIDEQEE